MRYSAFCVYSIETTNLLKSIMDTLVRSYHHGRSALGPDALSRPFRAYIVGKPVSQSLSPLLQNIMFRRLPSHWTFEALEITEKRDFKALISDPNCIGVSITIPNKLSFQPCLDEIAAEARVTGAVNTTFIRLDESGKRKYIGTNTDCHGLRDAILQRVPNAMAKCRGQPALVIGGGGAARGAIYALWKWFEPSEIYVINRLASEVGDMIESFEHEAPGLSLRHLSSVEEAMAQPVPFLIVGTIPDYPPREPGEYALRDIIDAVIRRPRADKGIVADMCYIPSLHTHLYTQGGKQGWQVVSGVEIVVRVCIAQQLLWTERLPDERGMEEALDAVSRILSPPQGTADSKL